MTGGIGMGEPRHRDNAGGDSQDPRRTDRLEIGDNNASNGMRKCVTMDG